MHDVAALAGVSQRTVSNVVNGYVHVRAETRERVQKAIDELKYRPNVSARNLRTGRSGLIALAVPEIAAPYFAELADRVQQEADRVGLVLLVSQTGGTRERELQVLDGFSSAVIDGLILSPVALTAADLASHEMRIPTLLLGERVDAGEFIHVSVDNVEAARVATMHLLGKGRKRIAALGVLPETLGLGPGVRRLEGFHDALKSAGLYDRRIEISSSEWTLASGYEAATRALREHPDVDAFFCFNDLMAIGAIKALNDQGVPIPEQVAIVGWDDIKEAAFTYPPLTTIAPDKITIAQRSVERLVSRIGGSGPTVDEIVAPFTLIKRES